MIDDITGDGPIQIAIQRAFDVLGVEDAIDVVGYLELQPDAAISVLVALEAVETRRNRPSRGAIGPAKDDHERVQRLPAKRRKAPMMRWLGW
jgi:hypothetical protein